MSASAYRVTFPRIGRSANGSFTEDFAATSANELADAIYRFCRPRLASREFTVVVDLERMEGSIEAGRFGTFTIEQIDEVPAVNCTTAVAAIHHGYPQDPDADEPRIVIHTYLGFIGADWDRDEVVRTIHEHPDQLRVASPDSFMWKMGHRLFIDRYTERGSALFIETREGAFEQVPA